MLMNKYILEPRCVISWDCDIESKDDGRRRLTDHAFVSHRRLEAVDPSTFQEGYRLPLVPEQTIRFFDADFDVIIYGAVVEIRFGASGSFQMDAAVYFSLSELALRASLEPMVWVSVRGCVNKLRGVLLFVYDSLLLTIRCAGVCGWSIKNCLDREGWTARRCSALANGNNPICAARHHREGFPHAIRWP